MKLSPTAALEHARTDEGRKKLRYAGISVVFLPLGQVIVAILHVALKIVAFKAVIITACILTPPNYLANKYLVWRDNSKDKRATEIAVFWIAALLGTGAATGLVFLAEKIVPVSSGKLLNTAAVFGGQVLGYGSIWILRYVFLDRLIYKVSHQGGEPPADVLDDLHHDFPV